MCHKKNSKIGNTNIFLLTQSIYCLSNLKSDNYNKKTNSTTMTTTTMTMTMTMNGDDDDDDDDDNTATITTNTDEVVCLYCTIPPFVSRKVSILCLHYNTANNFCLSLFHLSFDSIPFV